MGLLVSRYRVPIIISVLYLGLSITYHVVSLNTRWYEPQSFWWTDQLLALFILHRSGRVGRKYISNSRLEWTDEELHTDIDFKFSNV